MSNVHDLFSNKDDEDDDDHDDSNNRYVGGIGDRGGGSGLAVQPNTNDLGGGGDSSDATTPEAIFGLAQQASGNDRPPRRTITMYRNGFVVDDGPYRRLDDPANAEFLRSLAQGRTPRELLEGANNSEDVTVGLIDKRSQEYQETFKSFSGTGNSLGSATTTSDSGDASSSTNNGILDPSSFPSSDTTPPPVDESSPTTSIQVRLMNGQRQILKINLSQTVEQLGRMIGGDVPFVLTSGFPPRPITDLSKSIEEAGLKGAQVIQKKA